mgnify:CR=1 FL=1|jgi:hypothetical protein
MEEIYQKNNENSEKIRNEKRKILIEKLKKDNLNDFKYKKLETKYNELLKIKNDLY